MKSTKQSTHIATGLFSFIAIVFILYALKPFIIPLFVAIILSVMVFPVQKYMERKWRCNRLLATTVSLFLLMFSVAGLAFLIFNQMSVFVDKSDTYIEKISQLYYKSMLYFDTHFGLKQNNLISQNDLKIENIIKDNFDQITNLISQSGSLLGNLIVIPIYIFFFLYYRVFFRTFVYKLFRSQSKSKINVILRKIYQVQQNYLSGLTKVIVIVGLMNSVGLLLLGIENAFFFGFFAAFLLLIPYIGIIIGSILPALFALATKDSVWYSVGVIGIFWFIQILEGNFITPKITGSKVSINAFVAITSLVLFSMLWGTAGMILALPVTATLKILFDHIPGFEAYGFLIGEPVDKHLKDRGMLRLKLWKKIRSQKAALHS